MKTRAAEIHVAPGEVILAVTDNDARLAVRLTPEEAQLLACELASASIQARDKVKEVSSPPVPLQRVR